MLLASASPRRRELLHRLVPSFETTHSSVEERGSTTFPDFTLAPLELPPPFYIPPDQDPRLWAWRKALDAASRAVPENGERLLVLGADTVVVSQERPLGKPSPGGAAAMLKHLRGRPHYVVTGYVLILVAALELRTLICDAQQTRVVMRAFSDDELMGYVATGEPYDKAGAYALQGLGGKLVERVEGCRTNVIGLPLCAIRAHLSDAGHDVLPYPERGYCESCSSLNKSGERFIPE